MTRTSTHSLLLFLISLTVFAGCMAEEGDRFTTTRQEIRGGQTENAETAVVGILINLDGGAGICSGTLIAPNMVLTAQHCVAALNSQFVVCGQTPFGNQYSANSLLVTTSTQMTNDPNQYRSVREVQVPPGTDDTCGFDIALLILDEAIPASVATPIAPRIDEAPQQGETYTAIGYGHVGDGSGSGTRRSLGGRQVVCTGSECPGNSSVQGTEWMGTDGTCQGDSGGAALDTEGRVLGALSRGPDGCQGSLYSGVWAWSDWMRTHGERAANIGGYQAPVWVTSGVSQPPADDPDLDGISTGLDNCPNVTNPDQNDEDGDLIGDACDDDMDGDGVLDPSDNCPDSPNSVQSDFDFDGMGDVCDNDDDGDGIDDLRDNCRTIANPFQSDLDNNGIGDDCEGMCDVQGANGEVGDCLPNPTGAPTVVIFDEPAADGEIHATGSIGCSSTGGSPIDLLWVFAAPLLVLRRRRPKH